MWFDIHGATSAGVEYLPDQGQIVVNVLPGGQLPERESLQAVTDVNQGSETMAVRGYVRPFESSLTINVVDSEGALVDVTAKGEAVWLPGPGVIGLVTTDWMEAWGWYEFTLDLSPLPPGDYVVSIKDESGGGPGASALVVSYSMP